MKREIITGFMLHDWILRPTPRKDASQDSLAPSTREADLNLPRRHLGVFLLADEVAFGGAELI
jgi:hypothetical protein